MRESFVLIISLFVISVRCSNLDRDGFNIYKDHLRTRSDEPLEGTSVVGDRILYFFRAPLQMYSSHLPVDPQEYRKREANIYKSHMLTKELSPLEKRTSKAALSLMLQSKQDFDHTDEDHYCPHGK
ncbi:uncharacterized protein LOC126772746 [Nymphalis io]|uniref:uncharacterized protein LOC126772746 n=1 Tax=Inachis io TaxID=171585 RepID=UPI00216A234D|nr:uncharacterized protein LOC126772746 [Nymphalis io]